MWKLCALMAASSAELVHRYSTQPCTFGNYVLDMTIKIESLMQCDPVAHPADSPSVTSYRSNHASSESRSATRFARFKPVGLTSPPVHRVEVLLQSSNYSSIAVNWAQGFCWSAGEVQLCGSLRIFDHELRSCPVVGTIPSPQQVQLHALIAGVAGEQQIVLRLDGQCEAHEEQGIHAHCSRHVA